MKRSALLLLFLASIGVGPVKAQTSMALTEADWLAAAKTALKLSTRLEQVTFIVDDSLAREARNALARLGKIVPLADMPNDREAVFSVEHMRILAFRVQGERVEFLEGSVYPKAYQPGDCRYSSHLFLVRHADGAWTQDGQVEVHVCAQ